MRRMKLTVGKVVLLSAWLITLFGAMVTGAYGHKHRDRIRSYLSSVQSDPPVATNLYTLRVEKIALPAGGRDGGIAALGTGVLMVTRDGVFSFIDSTRTVRTLGLSAPVNAQEFRSDPFNAKTLFPELFGLKDLALDVAGDRIRVFVSHNHWHRDQQCNTMRVSSLETTEAELLGTTPPAATWRTLFETTPCRPLESAGTPGQRAGLGVGGRVALLPDGGVLLTVGGFDPENELVLDAPQKADNSYGKTIRIDPVTGESRIYSFGHRNPQGLTVAATGEVWVTEHAARGGDELNRISDGGNFGYPRVTYGTQYEMMTWPYSATQGRHEGFDKPTFVWTPSVGISQLIALEKNAFPHWRGDLMISTLGAQSLLHVRVEDGVVRFVEPIPVGHRVRDIVEAHDGTIVLKTDDDFVIYISPLDASTAKNPVERGAALAAGCQACHSLTAGGNNGIGPALWGIVGRPVASSGRFTYSEALSGTGGRWTPERLTRFLADPSAFAPGTLMQLQTKYTEDQIADLVAYLHTLR